MSPEFAAAVDPVYCLVLDVLDRLTAGERLEPHAVQREIIDALEHGDAAVGATDAWRLARYALAAWIDEVLLDAAWSGRDWWNNNVLEAEIFRTRECSEVFFLKAEQARGLATTDALEVFYDCVVLGFRGMYRSQDIAQSRSHEDGLSDSLEAWLRRTALALQKREIVSPSLEQIPKGAPPRTARRWLVGTGFLFLFLLVVDVLLYHFQGAA